jgi:hypothetical protein
MADNISDAEERRLLDLSLPSGSVYMALFTAAPSDTGGGTEVSGGTYARQPVTLSAAITTGGLSSKSNSTTITYPVATAAWGTIVAYGIYDAATGGNLRWWRALSATATPVIEQRTVGTNDQYQIPAGALTFTLG